MGKKARKLTYVDIGPPKWQERLYNDPCWLARYHFKTMWGNTVCPYPNCHQRPTDAHHVFVTRHPDHPDLYCRENMVLVCNGHHVPPAKDLNYWCALWMLTKGKRTPEQIEAWVRGLREKGIFEVTPSLPDFYYKAKRDARKHGVQEEDLR